MACIGGVIAALGFAPLNLWPLTLLGLAVLMSLVGGARNWSAAAVRGWLWGCGHFIVNFNWIAHAFTFQDNMPHWFGWIAVVALAAFLALYVAAVAGATVWVVQLCSRESASPDPNQQLGSRLRGNTALSFTLIFSAFWVVGEYARATLLTGFAWDPIGVTMEPALLRQSAKWIGTYGLSGLTVLFASFVMTRRTTIRALVVIAFLVVWLGGLYAHGGLIKRAIGDKEPLLTIVQPNIPEDIGADQRQYFANLITHMRLSGLADPHHPRLILWPEGSLTDYIGDERWARERLAAILGPHDILAAGGPKLEFDAHHHLIGARNAIFLLNARAEIVGRYDKAHLVPGGEYLPLRTILSQAGLNRLVPGDLDFLPGPGPRTLSVPSFGKMGGLICYEVIFSGNVVDRAHRPDFIFNPSTDAWFGAWGPPQHLAQAQMRALEEGLPIIRATTTGISAVIAADGEVWRSLPLNTQGTLISFIPPADAPTLFSKYGNLIPLGLATVLALIGLALAQRKP